MDKNRDFSVIRKGKSLPDPRSVDCSAVIGELWEDYLDSAGSVLPELEASALKVEGGEDVESQIANIKRILHSVKGESGMVGLQDVHDLCHEVESAIAELEDYFAVADMVLKAKDWMQSAIDIASGNGKPDGNSETHQATDQSKKRPTRKTAKQSVARRKNSDRLKALIIDDTVVCRKRLRMLLRNYFECSFAVHGREGFETYQQAFEAGEPFDLVTLDINMPEMDGHQTLDAIRTFEAEQGLEGLEGVKIVMTTSQGGSEHVFQAFRQGCEAYVIKSGMGDKLIEEIAKLGLLKVCDYMRKQEPVCVQQDASLLEAATTLLESELGSVPVVDQQKNLVGVLAETDLLELLMSTQEQTASVSNVMSSELISFDQEDSLHSLCEAIQKHQVTNIPITSDGKLVGVMSRNEIVKGMVQLRQSELKPSS